MKHWMIAALVGGLAPTLSCEQTPAAGDPCKPSEIRCLDDRTELACDNGVFVEAPCHGPKGCREGQDTLSCDITGNRTGDRCATDEEGNGACLDDGSRRIVCRGGEYVVEPCRGGRGCYRENTRVRCDQSKARVGDPCTGSTHACGMGEKTVLACNNGRFEQQAECPGEEGCQVADGRLACDQGEKSDD